jgi:RNA polymerase sigma-70 factor (ECF subfamily)
MLESHEESTLIEAAVRGDAGALEQLLLTHFSVLQRHIAPKIPAAARRHLAVEDVLQDTFAQVFRDISQFDSRANGSFLGWLKTIAEHRLADTLKRIRRKKRGGNQHQLSVADVAKTSTVANLIDLVYQDSKSPFKSVVRRDRERAIRIAVAGLPPDQRDVIGARFFEGKTVGEIAQTTDRTDGAVRGLIHRAKEKLREVMGRSSRWLSSR